MSEIDLTPGATADTERGGVLRSLGEAFLGTLRGVDQPRYLAVGLVLGVGVGLIPKLSIIPVLLFCGLVLTPANLATGIAGIVIGHLLFEPFLATWESWGVYCLSRESFQTFWVQWHRLPGAEWLRLGQPAVMGATMAWSAASPLMFGGALAFFRWYGPWLSRQIGRSSWTRWMNGKSAVD